MAERFLQAYGVGHLLEDPRFASNQARVEHGEALDREVAAAIASRTLDENLRIIEAHELTAVAVQTVADIEQDPHWRERGLLLDVPDGDRAIRMHTVVPRLSGTPGTIAWPGGELGEHNHDIYATELGLTGGALDDLKAAGVI